MKRFSLDMAKPSSRMPNALCWGTLGIRCRRRRHSASGSRSRRPKLARRRARRAPRARRPPRLKPMKRSPLARRAAPEVAPSGGAAPARRLARSRFCVRSRLLGGEHPSVGEISQRRHVQCRRACRRHRHLEGPRFCWRDEAARLPRRPTHPWPVGPAACSRIDWTRHHAGTCAQGHAHGGPHGQLTVSPSKSSK